MFAFEGCECLRNVSAQCNKKTTTLAGVSITTSDSKDRGSKKTSALTCNKLGLNKCSKNSLSPLE